MSNLTEIVPGKPGFLPNGGGKDATYGRNPEGIAYTKGGDLRKTRKTLTALERLQKEEEARTGRLRGYARAIFANVATIAALLRNAAVLRAWDREAVSYDSQEKVNAKAERARAYIDSLQARHVAALAYLDSRADLSVLETFEANVGADVEAFMRENEREPDAEEAEEMCMAHIDAGLKAALASAADPANDPFAQFRRDAADSEDDSQNDDSDTL